MNDPSGCLDGDPTWPRVVSACERRSCGLRGQRTHRYLQTSWLFSCQKSLIHDTTRDTKRHDTHDSVTAHAMGGCAVQARNFSCLAERGRCGRPCLLPSSNKRKKRRPQRRRPFRAGRCVAPTRTSRAATPVAAIIASCRGHHFDEASACLRPRSRRLCVRALAFFKRPILYDGAVVGAVVSVRRFRLCFVYRWIQRASQSASAS